MANSGEPFTEWLVGNIDQPVRVENIYIQGLQKTKIDFIANIFKAVATSANVRDLYANSNFVMERINGLGIFKETELAFFEGSEPGSTNVQFTAQEKKNRSFSIKKEFGADGSSVVVNGGVGNLFGRAEELDCHFKMASKTHFSFGTTFKKPFVTTQKTYQMELESFKEIRDCTEHSRYHEDAQGAVIRMLFPFKGLFHTFSYENLWREISGLPNGTPSKVRDHSGHFLKGSLRHQVTFSNLDTVIFPTAGHSINLQNEVAGIVGNVDYFKHEFTGTKYFKIVDRLVLSIGLGAGMMYSMRGSQLPLSDRFYLGGPSSLKGFAQKSIGERQESACLGGSVYGLFSSKLYIPISSEESSGDALRALVLFNAGANMLRNEGETIPQCVERVKDHLRTSVGFGIAFGTPVGQLEFTYTVPLMHREDDKVQKIQFGFSF